MDIVLFLMHISMSCDFLIHRSPSFFIYHSPRPSIRTGSEPHPFIGSGLVVDIRLSGLGAKVLLLQGILPSVLDKVGAALAKFKGHVFADALRPQGEHPVKVHGPGKPVRLPACHHQFHAVQIPLQING